MFNCTPLTSLLVTPDDAEAEEEEDEVDEDDEEEDLADSLLDDAVDKVVIAL